MKYDQEILDRCYKENWYVREYLIYDPERFREMLRWKRRMDMQNLWQIEYPNQSVIGNVSQELDPEL